MRIATVLSVLSIVVCVACGDKSNGDAAGAGTGAAAGSGGAGQSATSGTGATAGTTAVAGTTGTAGATAGAGAAGSQGGAGSTAGAGGEGGMGGAGGEGGSGGAGGTGGTESNDCCAVHAEPGCRDAVVETCVCAALPDCCEKTWDAVCVQIVTEKYCQEGVRDCVCGTGVDQWAQTKCCETSWTNLCDLTAVNKCGAEAGCH